jgi:hypothetical protein
MPVTPDDQLLITGSKVLIAARTSIPSCAPTRTFSSSSALTEKALIEVIQKVYFRSISIDSVDNLVKGMGGSGISSSES